MFINITKKVENPILKAIQFDGTLKSAAFISEHTECVFKFTKTKYITAITELQILIDGNWRYVSKLDYIIFQPEPIICGPMYFNRVYQEVK